LKGGEGKGRDREIEGWMWFRTWIIDKKILEYEMMI